ncbi:MAG: kelch repeat-containing protein, partial [Candidatus Marinimicrobia bacterium]|nr:kelch repeat-containing protein [Candidatus Neomarinimicrobiota bacterium]
MKTQKICLIIVFCLFFCSFLLADEWTIAGQLNEGRDSQFATALLPDGKSVLITGGYATDELIITSHCEIFDFQTGQAVFTDSLPIPLYEHRLIKLDLADEQYLTVGGITIPPNNPGRCFCYSPQTNTWVETGELNYPRCNHAAIAFQDTNETIKVL